MMRRTLVCLANSYKHGGRCVAGICLENGKWFRLRNADGDGSLHPRHYHLAEGKGELRLLDVFEVDLHYAMPTDCHPEDWVTASRAWRLIERPCSTQTWNRIIEGERGGATIFKGYRDRIPACELQSNPLKASLTLIRPETLWWWIREEHGTRKSRALFRRHCVTYELALTDPRWLDQLNLLPVGIYPHKLLAPDAAETWLTISLSEAFSPGAGEAAHFKLVAGVVVR